MDNQETQTLTQYQALKKTGFFQTVDYCVVWFIFLSWTIIFGWNIAVGYGVINPEKFHKFSMTNHALLTVVVMLAWLIALVYRCMYFVLQLTASVKLMPYEAARILKASNEPNQPR